MAVTVCHKSMTTQKINTGNANHMETETTQVTSLGQTLYRE